MNRPIHFELGVVDPPRALKFYEDVFGWKTQTWDGPQKYWLLTTGPETEPGINGGLMVHQDKAPRVVNTIGVSSVEESSRKIQQSGGKVVMPKFPIPGIGWQACCLDTEGNLFGVHESDPGAK